MIVSRTCSAVCRPRPACRSGRPGSAHWQLPAVAIAGRHDQAARAIRLIERDDLPVVIGRVVAFQEVLFVSQDDADTLRSIKRLRQTLINELAIRPGDCCSASCSRSKDCRTSLRIVPITPRTPMTKAAISARAASEPVVLPKEIGGREGLEPTRYGDWEKNGRCIDF